MFRHLYSRNESRPAYKDIMGIFRESFIELISLYAIY